MVVHVTVVVLLLLLLLLVMITIVKSGLSAETWSSFPYPDDPLCDGQNCNKPESSCCTNPNMPFFLKTLNETITDNTELRVCSDQLLPDEDTPIDIIEIYVK